MNADGREIVLALRADCMDGAAAVTRGGAEEAIPLENTDPYGFTTAPFDASDGGFAEEGYLRVTIGVPETATASIAEAHIRFAIAAACGNGENCGVTPGERDAIIFGEQTAELAGCALTVAPALPDAGELARGAKANGPAVCVWQAAGPFGGLHDFLLLGRGWSYSVQPSSAASRMAYMALAAWTQSPRVWTGMPRAAMDASIV